MTGAKFSSIGLALAVASVASVAWIGACDRGNTGTQNPDAAPAATADPVPADPCPWTITLGRDQVIFEGEAGMHFTDKGGEIFSGGDATEIGFVGVLAPLNDSEEKASVDAELRLRCDFPWCGRKKVTFIESGWDAERTGYEIFTADLGYNEMAQRDVYLNVSCESAQAHEWEAEGTEPEE